MLTKTYRDLYVAQKEAIGGEKMSYICYNVARQAGNFYASDDPHIRNGEKRSAATAQNERIRIYHHEGIPDSTIVDQKIGGVTIVDPVDKFIKEGIVTPKYLSPTDTIASPYADNNIPSMAHLLTSFNTPAFVASQERCVEKEQTVC